MTDPLIRFDFHAESIFGDPWLQDEAKIPVWYAKLLANRPLRHDRLRRFAGEDGRRQSLVKKIVEYVYKEAALARTRLENNEPYRLWRHGEGRRLLADARELARSAEELAEAYDLVFFAAPDAFDPAHPGDRPEWMAYRFAHAQDTAPDWPWAMEIPRPNYTRSAV